MGRDSEDDPADDCCAISIHSPRMGRDPLVPEFVHTIEHFNPLSPHGERLSPARPAWPPLGISIHSPRMGRDRLFGFLISDHGIFQSTLPAWGETRLAGDAGTNLLISIHSPRMGRDEYNVEFYKKNYEISIHSPRMGRDLLEDDLSEDSCAISIHSPRMGRDINAHTSPTKGQYFNPLSPHGERHGAARRWMCLHPISIHSPRMGRDGNPVFNAKLDQISIHSPRMGRDHHVKGLIGVHFDFNPLSPHGERPVGDAIQAQRAGNFNPLSPHGERLLLRFPFQPIMEFQSTLPAWGETYKQFYRVPDFQHFNPLSPHGERPHDPRPETCRAGISIHSPRMGRDPLQAPKRTWPTIFQSTLPAWGETGSFIVSS